METLGKYYQWFHEVRPDHRYRTQPSVLILEVRLSGSDCLIHSVVAGRLPRRWKISVQSVKTGERSKKKKHGIGGMTAALSHWYGTWAPRAQSLLSVQGSQFL